MAETNADRIEILLLTDSADQAVKMVGDWEREGKIDKRMGDMLIKVWASNKVRSREE